MAHLDAIFNTSLEPRSQQGGGRSRAASAKSVGDDPTDASSPPAGGGGGGGADLTASVRRNEDSLMVSTTTVAAALEATLSGSCNPIMILPFQRMNEAEEEEDAALRDDDDDDGDDDENMWSTDGWMPSNDDLRAPRHHHHHHHQLVQMVPGGHPFPAADGGAGSPAADIRGNPSSPNARAAAAAAAERTGGERGAGGGGGGGGKNTTAGLSRRAAKFMEMKRQKKTSRLPLPHGIASTSWSMMMPPGSPSHQQRLAPKKRTTVAATMTMTGAETLIGESLHDGGTPVDAAIQRAVSCASPQEDMERPQEEEHEAEGNQGDTRDSVPMTRGTNSGPSRRGKDPAAAASTIRHSDADDDDDDDDEEEEEDEDSLDGTLRTSSDVDRGGDDGTDGRGGGSRHTSSGPTSWYSRTWYGYFRNPDMEDAFIEFKQRDSLLPVSLWLMLAGLGVLVDTVSHPRFLKHGSDGLDLANCIFCAFIFAVLGLGCLLCRFCGWWNAPKYVERAWFMFMLVQQINGPLQNDLRTPVLSGRDWRDAFNYWNTPTMIVAFIPGNPRFAHSMIIFVIGCIVFALCKLPRYQWHDLWFPFSFIPCLLLVYRANRLMRRNFIAHREALAQRERAKAIHRKVSRLIGKRLPLEMAARVGNGERVHKVGRAAVVCIQFRYTPASTTNNSNTSPTSSSLPPLLTLPPEDLQDFFTEIITEIDDLRSAFAGLPVAGDGRLGCFMTLFHAADDLQQQGSASEVPMTSMQHRPLEQRACAFASKLCRAWNKGDSKLHQLQRNVQGGTLECGIGVHSGNIHGGVLPDQILQYQVFGPVGGIARRLAELTPSSNNNADVNVCTVVHVSNAVLTSLPTEGRLLLTNEPDRILFTAAPVAAAAAADKPIDDPCLPALVLSPPTALSPLPPGTHSSLERLQELATGGGGGVGGTGISSTDTNLCILYRRMLRYRIVDSTTVESLDDSSSCPNSHQGGGGSEQGRGSNLWTCNSKVPQERLERILSARFGLKPRPMFDVPTTTTSSKHVTPAASTAVRVPNDPPPPGTKDQKGTVPSDAETTTKTAAVIKRDAAPVGLPPAKGSTGVQHHQQQATAKALWVEKDAAIISRRASRWSMAFASEDMESAFGLYSARKFCDRARWGWLAFMLWQLLVLIPMLSWGYYASPFLPLMLLSILLCILMFCISKKLKRLNRWGPVVDGGIFIIFVLLNGFAIRSTNLQAPMYNDAPSQGTFNAFYIAMLAMLRGQDTSRAWFLPALLFFTPTFIESLSMIIVSISSVSLAYFGLCIIAATALFSAFWSTLSERQVFVDVTLGERARKETEEEHSNVAALLSRTVPRFLIDDAAAWMERGRPAGELRRIVPMVVLRGAVDFVGVHGGGDNVVGLSSPPLSPVAFFHRLTRTTQAVQALLQKFPRVELVRFIGTQFIAIVRYDAGGVEGGPTTEGRSHGQVPQVENQPDGQKSTASSADSAPASVTGNATTAHAEKYVMCIEEASPLPVSGGASSNAEHVSTHTASGEVREGKPKEAIECEEAQSVATAFIVALQAMRLKLPDAICEEANESREEWCPRWSVTTASGPHVVGILADEIECAVELERPTPTMASRATDIITTKAPPRVVARTKPRRQRTMASMNGSLHFLGVLGSARGEPDVSVSMGTSDAPPMPGVRGANNS